MNFKPLLTFVAILIFATQTSAQFGFNTTGATPDNSAMVDISSTTKGLLIPRMTTTQRITISSPATGLVVYDLSLNLFYYYNGTVWTALSSTSTDNLGNHTATQNIILGNYYLSSAGTNYGLKVDANFGAFLTGPSTSNYLSIGNNTKSFSGLNLFTNTKEWRISNYDNKLHFHEEIEDIDPFVIESPTSDYLLYLKGDKVGIGTTSPTEKFEVSGKTKTTTFQMTSNADVGKVLQSDANGNASWSETIKVDMTNETIGTSWDADQNYAALSGKGGNASYQAGVYGYVKGSAAHTGGVVGAFDASTWGALGYRDNNLDNWGVYANGSAKVAGKLTTTNFKMTNGSTDGYVLQSDSEGNGSWINPSTLNVPNSWTTLSSDIYNNNAGNIGIGTSSPNAKLEIVATTAKPLTITSSNTTATDLTFKNTSSNSSSIIRWTGSGNGLGSKKLFFMNPDNAIVMTIDHYLNRVGIGTDSPAELMDVNGKTKTADFQMTTGASNGRILKSDATGNASWVSISSIETDPKVANTTSNYLARWNGTSLIDGSIYDNGAQVGIGTSNISVDSKLAIGAVNSAEGGQIQLNSGSARTVAYFMDNYDDKLRIMSGTNSASLTHHFTMNNTGNIGLGTFSPTEKLDVRGKTKTETFQMTETASNGFILTSDANGNSTWSSPQSSTSWTVLNTNLYSALAGNVGIGISTPTSKLHVSGTTTLAGQVNFNDNWNIQSGSDFWLEKNGTRYMTVYGTGGYTGIGTNTPKSLLEVNGAIGIKISTQSGNTAIILDNTATVWYFTGTASITLPTASTCTNRLYRIVNRQGSNRTISSFINTSGTAITSISANSTVEIISDGSNWLQIN